MGDLVPVVGVVGEAVDVVAVAVAVAEEEEGVVSTLRIFFFYGF